MKNIGSWTQAAPFKEEKFHRTPTECIGNNYTPSARNLRIQNLTKKRLTSNGNGINRIHFTILYSLYILNSYLTHSRTSICKLFPLARL